MLPLFICPLLSERSRHLEHAFGFAIALLAFTTAFLAFRVLTLVSSLSFIAATFLPSISVIAIRRFVSPSVADKALSLERLSLALLAVAIHNEPSDNHRV